MKKYSQLILFEMILFIQTDEKLLQSVPHIVTRRNLNSLNDFFYENDSMRNNFFYVNAVTF